MAGSEAHLVTWMLPLFFAIAMYATREGNVPTKSTKPTTKKPPPLPKPNGVSKWFRIAPSAAYDKAGKHVTLVPKRVYAAVLQLGVLERLASNGAVVDRLRELAPWTTLRVWDDAKDTPAAFPGTREESGGRRWALGQFGGASAKTVALPEQVHELWELKS